jgi:hypothetical protein
MFKHTFDRVNNYILYCVTLLLVTFITHDHTLTVVVFSALAGGLLVYLLCLLHIGTLWEAHGKKVDGLFQIIDGLDDQLEDAQEDLAYEKTRDTLFDDVIDTIRLSSDPQAIAAMVAAYDILRDEKDRYIRAHSSQRLQDLEAMQHPAPSEDGLVGHCLADPEPCASPT